MTEKKLSQTKKTPHPHLRKINEKTLRLFFYITPKDMEHNVIRIESRSKTASEKPKTPHQLRAVHNIPAPATMTSEVTNDIETAAAMASLATEHTVADEPTRVIIPESDTAQRNVHGRYLVADRVVNKISKWVCMVDDTVFKNTAHLEPKLRTHRQTISVGALAVGYLGFCMGILLLPTAPLTWLPVGVASATPIFMYGVVVLVQYLLIAHAQVRNSTARNDRGIFVISMAMLLWSVGEVVGGSSGLFIIDCAILVTVMAYNFLRDIKTPESSYDSFSNANRVPMSSVQCVGPNHLGAKNPGLILIWLIIAVPVAIALVVVPFQFPDNRLVALSITIHLSVALISFIPCASLWGNLMPMAIHGAGAILVMTATVASIVSIAFNMPYLLGAIFVMRIHGSILIYSVPDGISRCIIHDTADLAPL